MISVNPSSIAAGDSVTLTCTSSSESSLTLSYEWLQDGTVLSDISKVLTLASFTASTDAGIYTCAAVNNGVKSQYSDATNVVVDGKTQQL